MVIPAAAIENRPLQAFKSPALKEAKPFNLQILAQSDRVGKMMAAANEQLKKWVKKFPRYEIMRWNKFND